MTLALTPDRLALVAGNERFAHQVVRRTLPRLNARGLDYAAAVQEARLGLVRAARRFDQARGVPFPNYAADWCRTRVHRWQAQEGRRGVRFAPAGGLSVVSLSPDPDGDPGPLADLVAPAPDPAVGLDVVRVLDSLNGIDRRLIELRYLVGLTAKETAAELGLSVPVVNYRTGRALAELRERFTTGVV